MSIAALNWAWSQDCPNASAKLVLLALADKANDEGECWPGMDHVAKMAGVSSRQVSTHLARLEAEGLIRRKRRRSVLGHLGRYTFTLNLTTGSELPVDDQGKSTSGSTPPVEADRQWKSDVATTGSSASSATGSGLPDKKQPPRFNPQEATSPDFEVDFWSRYPKRDGKRVGRKQAVDQWRKLSVADRRLVVIAVDHYRQAAEDPGVFCPIRDPWRWLRDRLFDDWQEPAEPSGPGHLHNVTQLKAGEGGTF